ncbi:MAG: hypothetical protein ABUL71_00805 [Gemmatimonadota bacterium]
MTRIVAALVLLGAAIPTLSASAQQVDSAAADVGRNRPGCGACITGTAIGLHMPVTTAQDTGRPRAIEYSDAYAVRLKIHQIGSYVELPLFVAEYILGNKLINDTSTFIPSQRESNSSTRSLHSAVATGLGALFTVNTITGVWNLIESRHEPAGRLRRWIHSIAMLMADAGFALTASAAGDAKRTTSGADHHRNLAIGSMGLATLSTLIMWLWKD